MVYNPNDVLSIIDLFNYFNLDMNTKKEITKCNIYFDFGTVQQIVVYYLNIVLNITGTFKYFNLDLNDKKKNYKGHYFYFIMWMI